MPVQCVITELKGLFTWRRNILERLKRTLFWFTCKDLNRGGYEVKKVSKRAGEHKKLTSFHFVSTLVAVSLKRNRSRILWAIRVTRIDRGNARQNCWFLAVIRAAVAMLAWVLFPGTRNFRTKRSLQGARILWPISKENLTTRKILAQGKSS